jgi:Icc-related predicted phosphoesterase
VKLQLISDLHLEFHQGPKRVLEALPIASNLDFLVIAGDSVVVNRQHEQEIIPFFKWASAQARHVLFIEGNHEYYGSKDSMHTDIQLAAYVGRWPNIHWLRNEWIGIDGVEFYGGCMWFPNKDGLNQLYERMIADFSQIKDLGHWVYNSNTQFRYEANRLVTPKTIVISHHLPHPESTPPMFRGDQSNRFFVSDESELIREKQPRLWLHGHTHSPCDYMLGETRVVCNPYGYPSERGSREYPQVLLEV